MSPMSPPVPVGSLQEVMEGGPGPCTSPGASYTPKYSVLGFYTSPHFKSLYHPKEALLANIISNLLCMEPFLKWDICLTLQAIVRSRCPNMILCNLCWQLMLSKHFIHPTSNLFCKESLLYGDSCLTLQAIVRSRSPQSMQWLDWHGLTMLPRPSRNNRMIHILR